MQQQSLSLVRRALLSRHVTVQNSRNNICLFNSIRSTTTTTRTQQQSALFHNNAFLRLATPPQQSPPELATNKQQQEQQQKSVPEKESAANKEEEQQKQQQQQEESATRGKQSLKDKLKEFIKKYGFTGVVVYFGIYYITWASFYFALEHNWFNAGDVMNLAKKFGMEKYVDIESDKSKKVANIGLAWFITKFTEPLRFGLTVLVTPSVLKFTKKILRRG